MKLHLTIILFALTTVVAVAQKQHFKDLTPVGGYYKNLQAISPAPKSSNEEIDKSRFPFNPESAARRLALKPYYLENITLEDFDIPAPPANSSAQTRAEINYLLQLQQQRTKIDVDASMYMAGVVYSLKATPEDANYRAYRQNLFHIGRSVGTWFNSKDLPLTADFMAHVWQDASFFIWSAKYKYLRVRPYFIDSDVKNLEDANWAAYPSGHATNSYVNAFVYQELMPEFAHVFIKDAYDMAHSREIIGVHYPSDSEAGRVLARQIVNKLFENEKFRRDFELVKKEWAEKAVDHFVKPVLANHAPVEQTTSCGTKKPEASACAKTCE